MAETTANARRHGGFETVRACAAREESGLSLLELMLAFALFSIVVAVAMQAYVLSYTGTIVQEQRTQAMQLARGVLNNLRELRDDPEASFPDSLVAHYPQGAIVADVRSPETSALGGQESVVIEYEDPTANPLTVRVVVEWRDPRNRRMVLDVTTLLSAR